MDKLHLGCGDVYLNGWINIDMASSHVDLCHNLADPLPYKNNSVQYIYSEHLIEHFPVDDAVKLLSECHRVLCPQGVLRVATFNLDYLVFRYLFFWKRQHWIKAFGYAHLQTKAEMLNLCFHEWGHKYLYNKEELFRRVKEAGFLEIYSVKKNKSRFRELSMLETREESNLIIEAIKHA